MFLLLLLLLSSIPVAADFNTEWHNMQKTYDKLIMQIPSHYETIMIPEWKKYQAIIAAFIKGTPTPNFLTHPPIMPSMVRIGFGRTQQFELNYLAHAISPKNETLFNTFKEHFIGGLGPDCPGKNFSSNALGQLFYLANILEQMDHEKVTNFIELGGGYGSLCYIVKSLIPHTTYIIIDLPEMIALQHLYLRLVLPNTPLIVHMSSGQQITPGAINLVPIFFMQNITISTDVFASHFALSECPIPTQQLIIDKKFFDAHVCFIVGEADGWGPTNAWYMPKHHTVVNAIKRLFTHSFSTIYHNFDGPICSYQITGVK